MSDSQPPHRFTPILTWRRAKYVECTCGEVLLEFAADHSSTAHDKAESLLLRRAEEHLVAANPPPGRVISVLVEVRV